MSICFFGWADHAPGLNVFSFIDNGNHQKVRISKERKTERSGKRGKSINMNMLIACILQKQRLKNKNIHHIICLREISDIA
jgi:hypothetical protein